MSFTNSISLKGLTTREAIADALYRATSGLDEKDLPLLQSALTQDIIFTIDGYEVSGFDNLRAMTLDSPVETTHFTTSVRIDIESDDATTANLTANSLAQHFHSGTGTRSDGKKFLRGAKHALVIVKDPVHGLWKIKTWTAKTTWTQGDVSILQPASS